LYYCSFRFLKCLLPNIIQARPVTALDAWTDFELRHEFDSPILTDSDYVTKANTGEVFPGATSPLGLSVSARALDLSFQFVIKEQFARFFEVNPWCIGRFNLFFQNQVFINVIDTFQRDIGEEITHHRSVDMAIFGHL
jgi:hypothetical protein